MCKKILWLDDHLDYSKDYLYFILNIVEQATKLNCLNLIQLSSLEEFAKVLKTTEPSLIAAAIIDVMIPLGHAEPRNLSTVGVDWIEIESATVGKCLVQALFDTETKQQISTQGKDKVPLNALMNKPLLVLSTLELEASDWDIFSNENLLYFVHKHDLKFKEKIESWFKNL